MDHARLRPVERCVLRMSDAGLPDAEIGRRLKRSAEHVGRVRGARGRAEIVVAPRRRGATIRSGHSNAAS